ncbi:unnamed protein product [Paramecium primaurelia]|uniref:Uncharacterized protein n=1 Tax=Paramecium primaurelia TaxID=5886 RepID=A0A8S1MZK2_PARPR|nr:unnamed protein product [Paramecium primaurelia]
MQIIVQIILHQKQYQEETIRMQCKQLTEEYQQLLEIICLLYHRLIIALQEIQFIFHTIDQWDMLLFPCMELLLLSLYNPIQQTGLGFGCTIMMQESPICKYLQLTMMELQKHQFIKVQFHLVQRLFNFLNCQQKSQSFTIKMEIPYTSICPQQRHKRIMLSDQLKFISKFSNLSKIFLILYLQKESIIQKKQNSHYIIYIIYNSLLKNQLLFDLNENFIYSKF